MIPVSYNTRSLTVRWVTTLATAFGIALVVYVLATALMLSEGIQRTMGSSGSRDNGFVLRKGSDAELASSIENATVGLILSAPGVAKDETGRPIGAGEVVVVITADKVGTDGQVSNVQVRGVADNVLKLRPKVRFVAGRPAQPGTDEVVIGERIRGRFAGMEIGKSFELKKNRPVTVVGVFSADGSSFESEVWADVETVRSSFGREGLVSSVTVHLESASKFDAFDAFVENDKQLGLEAMRETVYFEKQSEMTSLFVSIMGWAIAVFFALGAMIGAMITMYGAVSQREREIGTLRALGFSRLSILFSFLLESLMLALVGGGIGLVAALCMSFVSISMMNFATWSEVVFSFDPTPKILITALIFGGLMGLLGGFFPAVRAARTSPVKAMRA